jgi:hypothetical protein
VDEADLFAPQKPQKGDEVLLGHMENIVRRGRVKGFIPWLISQRPAVLNKNVLSQVDGLIAFKLTASQDRDALDAWIEGQADKAQGKEIKAAADAADRHRRRLAARPRHPRDGQFPPKVTFDSSRTPKRGEKLKSRKLKPTAHLAIQSGRLSAQSDGGTCSASPRLPMRRWPSSPAIPTRAGHGRHTYRAFAPPA